MKKMDAVFVIVLMYSFKLAFFMKKVFLIYFYHTPLVLLPDSNGKLFQRQCFGVGHNTQRERCKVVVVLLLLAMVSVGRHVTTHARERYEGAMRGLAKLVAR